MPLPHFLALILTVIAAAGLSLLIAHSVGLPFVWLAVGALVGAAVVRGLAWR
jgi:phosphate/sulfate permease